MWLDPRTFKDYTILEEACKIAQDIFKDIDILTVNSEHTKVVGEGIPGVDWRGITIYQKYSNNILTHKNIDIRFTQIQKMFADTDSIFQAVINVIGPNSNTPWHNDSQDYDSNPIKLGTVLSYQMMIGIITPEGDLGMEFKSGTIIRWKDGDILAFDGSEDHRGWNNTNDYRITMFLDVNKESFING